MRLISTTIFILLLMTFFSCSNNKIEEQPNDIVSINDDDQLLDDSLLYEKNSDLEMEEIANKETKEAEAIEVVKVDELEPVPETLEIQEELLSTSEDNITPSGFMVVDSKTLEMIPVEKCVHVVKNDMYNEPTCLKQR